MLVPSSSLNEELEALKATVAQLESTAAAAGALTLSQKLGQVIALAKHGHVATGSALVAFGFGGPRDACAHAHECAHVYE